MRGSFRRTAVRTALCCVSVAGSAGATACASAQPPAKAPAQAPAAPPPAITSPAGLAAERDSTAALNARRLAALPAAERDAWTRYVERSAALRAEDEAPLKAELARLGRTAMTP